MDGAVDEEKMHLMDHWREEKQQCQPIGVL
jgi:hypothetical protein